MNLSEFRDEVGKTLADRPDLIWECVVSRDPDDLDFEIHDIENEWSYVYSGTSWVAILAALRAAIANGDLEDPREKYPEYYD
jgi:hypothetical protein